MYDPKQEDKALDDLLTSIEVCGTLGEFVEIVEEGVE